MVPSPLQGTSHNTRSKAPPRGGSATALWWATSPAGCRTRRTWWASMQHRRPSSSLATTTPLFKTAAAAADSPSERPPWPLSASASGGDVAAASIIWRVFIPGEAHVSKMRRPLWHPSTATGTMETASCLDIAPSSVHRLRKPCSLFGPGALLRTTLGRSNRQTLSSQGRRTSGWACSPPSSLTSGQAASPSGGAAPAQVGPP
mmetsp:Transcript_19666/g.59334  ORF Transcript_19666/g.59334 Transcript_19666/m.59334 type:complete len:203 (-) Transcript_19666:330-938(-)